MELVNQFTIRIFAVLALGIIAPLPLYAQQSAESGSDYQSTKSKSDWERPADVAARSRKRFQRARNTFEAPEGPERLAEGNCSSSDCPEAEPLATPALNGLEPVANLRFAVGATAENLARTVVVLWDAPRLDEPERSSWRADHYDLVVVNDGRWRHYRIAGTETYGLPRRNRGRVDSMGQKPGTRPPHRQLSRPRQSARIAGLAEGDLQVYVRPIYRPGHGSDEAMAPGEFGQALLGKVVNTGSGLSSSKHSIGTEAESQSEAGQKDSNSMDEIHDDALAECIAEHYPSDTPVEDIISLDCASRGITDLTGLDEFYALIHLNLADNPIRDISALSRLFDLQFLSLVQVSRSSRPYGVSDLNPLARLLELQELHISGTPVTSLLPLTNLQSLRILYADSSGVEHVPDMSATQLEVLNLGYTQVFDISGLRDVLTLKELTLRRSEVGENFLGNLTPLIQNAIQEGSALNYADLRGQNGLFCAQLDTLGKLLARDQLYPPNECVEFLPDNLTSTANPAIGNDFVIEWELEDPPDNMVYELEMMDHQSLTYFTEERSLDFTSEPPLPYYVYTIRVRACLEESDSLASCSGWSAGLQQIVAANPDRPIGDAIAEVPDTNLRTCIEEYAGIGTDFALEFAGELTTLNCSGRNIDWIGGLAGFPNLSDLQLNNNSIASLGPMATLGGISWLDLSYNEISGQELANLAAIDQSYAALNLAGNGIESIDTLSGLGQVGQLGLAENQVSDLSPISQVPIDVLDSSKNEVEILPPLTGITELWMPGNNLNSLQGLASIAETLSLIQLSNNPLSTGGASVHDALSLLGSMNIAVLNETGLDTLHFAAGWDVATSIYVRDNPISDFSPLSERAVPLYLYADHTLLTNLSFVPELLHVLHARETAISGLSPLSETMAFDLVISGGDLSDSSSLGPMSGMSTLKTLEFSHNGVIDISALVELVSSESSSIEMIDLRGEVDAPCGQLLQLWQFGVLETGTSGSEHLCRFAAPDVYVTLDEDLQSYELNWSLEPVVPGYVGYEYHEIEYRLSGSSVPVGTVEVDGPEVSSSHLSLELPASGHWVFRIRACDVNGRCGEFSEAAAARYPLIAPTAVTGELQGQDAQIGWDYPVQPPNTDSFEFELRSLYPEADPAIVPWGTWAASISNFNQWPGNIIYVRACDGEGNERRCGPEAIWYPLAAPSHLTGELIGQDAHISWDYPFQPPNIGAIEFEVRSLDSEATTIHVPWGTWDTIISEFDQWPDGVVRVRICEEVDDQRRCGPDATWFPLLAPVAMQGELQGQDAHIAWDYPVDLPSHDAVEFELRPLFPVVDPIVVPQGAWTATISDIDQWPGGIVRLRLCSGAGEVRRCGPEASIRLSEPLIDPTIPEPSDVTLQPLNKEMGEYRLSWPEVEDERVIFYEVRELTVDEFGHEQPTDRRYATETNQIEIKRFGGLENLRFSVAACMRDEMLQDVCSSAVTTYSHTDGSIVAFDKKMVEDLCWYDPGEIEIEDVPNGNYAGEWAHSTVRIRWSYDLTYTAPSSFFADDPSADSGDGVPLWVGNNFMYIGFNNASHLSDGTLVWTPNPESEDGKFNVRVRTDGAPNQGSNPLRAWASLYTVGGHETGPASSIHPLRSDNGGQPYWNEDQKCDDDLAEEQMPASGPVGGPGELMPGHWSMPLGNNQGWRFYWTNRLDDEDAEGTFGLSYDLIAFWYTYALIDGQYSPIWYYSRMQKSPSGDGLFVEGDLMRPVQSSQGYERDISVGTVRVYFEHTGAPDTMDDNRHAWISINVGDDNGVRGNAEFQIQDFMLDESVWGDDPLAEPNPTDHYRGIWTEDNQQSLFNDVGKILSEHDFFMSEWVVGRMTALSVYSFDDSGDPIWFVSFICSEDFDEGDCSGDMPDIGAPYTVTSLYTVISNVGPFMDSPTTNVGVETFYPDGTGLARQYEHAPVPLGEPNYDPQRDSRSGHICLDINGEVSSRSYSINLGGDSCEELGSDAFKIRKIANLHAIDFSFPDATNPDEPTSCELGVGNQGTCEISLSWFTDDYYEQIEVDYVHSGSGGVQELANLCIDSSPDINEPFLVSGYTCEIDEPGEYRFELRGRRLLSDPTESTIAFSRKLNVTGSAVPQPEEPDAPQPDPNFGADSNSVQVGATRGSFDVTEGGAATYTVPIMTAPGSGGVEPELALMYNSQGSSGPLGIGWSVGGLSTIGRCGQTLEHDGLSTGVSLSEKDRFCMDGQRLILVSTSHEYGEVGTEYRLEFDDFTQIVAHGNTGEGVTHFIVRRKDGSVSTYGHSGESDDDTARIVAPKSQTLYAWPISRFQDSAGNFIEFAYDQPGMEPQDTSDQWIEWLPLKIAYTGNVRAGTDPFAYIHFESNPLRSSPPHQDQRRTGYVAGERLMSTRQIEAIRSTVLVDGSLGLLRLYNLDFDEDNFGNPLLESVQECWGEGDDDCFPATEFEWQKGALATNNPEQLDIPPFRRFKSARAGDLTGDGRQEVIVLSSRTGETRPQFRSLRNESPGSDDLILTESETSSFVGCLTEAEELGAWSLADLNGNGANGIIYGVQCDDDSQTDPDIDKSGLFYHAWDYDNEQPATKGEWIADLPDGDDLLMGKPSIMPLDWDADGLSDLILIDWGAGDTNAQRAAWLYRNESHGENSEGSEIAVTGPIDIVGWYDEMSFGDPPPGTTWCDENIIYSLDIIGPALADIDGSGKAALVATARMTRLCWKEGSPQSESVDMNGRMPLEEIYALASEHSEIQEVVRTSVYQLQDQESDPAVRAKRWGEFTSEWVRRVIPADMNGDGLTDFVVMRAQFGSSSDWDVYIYRNDGNSLRQSEALFDVEDKLAEHAQVFDYTGNGLPDLLVPSSTEGGANAHWKIYPWSPEGGGTFSNDDDQNHPRSGPRIGHLEKGDQTIFADLSGDGKNGIVGMFAPASWNECSGGSDQHCTYASRGELSHAVVQEPAGLNRLIRIEDGFGAWTRIEYGTLGQRSLYTRDFNGPYRNFGLDSVVYDIAFPMTVVSAATSLSPHSIWHAAEGDFVAAPENTARIEYYYAGAKLQAGGRGFLGFGQVASFDRQSGMLTRTFYHQDVPFVGRPRVTESWYVPNSQEPWSTNDNLEPVEPCPAGDCPNAGIDTSGMVMLGHAENFWIDLAESESKYFQPYLALSEEKAYMPTIGTQGTISGSRFTHRIVTRSDQFDGFGNPGRVEVTTYLSESGHIDAGDPDVNHADVVLRQTSLNKYENHLEDWHLGRLTCSIAISTRSEDGVASGVERQSVRRAEFDYDPESGILDSESVYGDGAGNLSACNSGESPRKQTTYELDDFGNRESTTVTTWDEYGFVELQRKSKKEFDADGRLVMRNLVNLDNDWITVEQRLDHDHYGNPQRIIDARGVESRQYFDAAGRPHYSYHADGSWSRVLHRQDAGTLSQYCPAGSRSAALHYAGGINGVQSVECKDRLGRKLRQVGRGFAGVWIYRDTHYDYASRPIGVSEPYFAGHERYWTITDYDELGRVWHIEYPSSDSDSRRRESIQHSWNSAESSREVQVEVQFGYSNESQVRTSSSNVLGETLWDEENDGSRTSFDYDALGQLVVTDGPLSDDAISVFYNELGHKEQMDDPDKGIWRYYHNALGEMVCQIDAERQAILTKRDSLGRKVQRWDLANLQTSDNPEDCALWRINGIPSRITITGTTQWEYGEVQNTPEMGQLISVTHVDRIDTIGSRTETTREYIYDPVAARPEQVTTTIKEITCSSQSNCSSTTAQYHERTTYDEHGRVFQQFDASGDERGERFVYNQFGHVQSIREAAFGNSGTIYWTIQSRNAHGRVTEAEMGNGMKVTATYDPASGAELSRMEQSGNGLNQLAQLHELFWDDLDRLERKNDWRGPGNLERFKYDHRNRLEQVELSATGDPGSWTTVQRLRYDAAGNIRCKSDVSGTGCSQQSHEHYIYGENGAGPHAVTTVFTGSTGSREFVYDAVGNVEDDGVRSLSYTSYSQLRRVTSGTQVSEFHYGPERNRVVQRTSDGETTHYLGSVEVVMNDQGTRYRRHIAGVALVTQWSSGETETSYLHTDHLGSLVAISDATGQVDTHMSFDAWGNRRNGHNLNRWQQWTEPNLPGWVAFVLQTTPRGYTGHEHLDEHGIIHMNGRIYDPHLARFLQADPFMEDTGTLNRYTYVHNNPLIYTDPSGYLSVKDAFKIAAAAFVTFYTGGIISGAWGTAGLSGAAAVGTAAAGGAIAGYIMTGSLEGALWGAFSGAVFGGIGQMFDVGPAGTGFWRTGLSGPEFAAQTLSHSLAGGTISKLQGGRFGHGFTSAGISKLATPGVTAKIDNPFLQATTITIIGGTTSRLTGGKFANGAITAAMAYAFAQVGRGSNRVGSGTEAESVLDLSVEERQVLFRAELEQLWEANQIRTWRNFDSPDAAATEILDLVAPLSRKYGLEVAGYIRQVDGHYRYTRPEVFGPTGATLSTRNRLIGYHTHPSGGLVFTNQDFNLGSGNDAAWVRASGRPLYLGVQSAGGAVGIAVCEPGACPNVGLRGTRGRTIRGF